MLFSRYFVTAAATCLTLITTALAVAPVATYKGGFTDREYPVALRIGNGGAGQSGLVEEISNAFIKYAVDVKKKDPFWIEWYKSDTTESIKYLASNTVDVGITYSEVAEKIAMQQGIAKKKSYYIFRDHFYLVGPNSNPAKLDNNTDILTMFSKMYQAAELGNTSPPVRFLARYDKSATSIKDSLLWLAVGQVPWAYAYSTWYHQYVAYPIQALTAAITLEEYTITDRGTLLSLDEKLQPLTTVYKRGSDNATDPLLNPAHLLIGAKATNLAASYGFAKFLVSPEGQKVITSFKKNGEQLYTGAPHESETGEFDLWKAHTEPYHFTAQLYE